MPGDKSISHRAAILGALAHGVSVVRGFSPAGDCASTLSALSVLGVRIEYGRDGGGGDGIVRIGGPVDEGRRDAVLLDCGRAGTAMRLLAGVAASLPGTVTLDGDPQLLRRPMGRVAEPLRDMGARIQLAPGDRAPMRIEGGHLRGIRHRTPVASAQVKSALLLAGLRAAGRTTVEEPVATRDHTERMLAAMGAKVGGSPGVAWIERSELAPIELEVPGDASSAAFLWAAAAIVPDSDLTVADVGLNPARIGFLRILRRMAGDVEIEPSADRCGEPVGTVHVRHAPLVATCVEADEVPSAVDELPLVGLLATQAEGATVVRGARELRVKESDRITGLVEGLRAMGADAQELPDGFAVGGPTRLRGASVDSLGDHRLAMTFAIAGLVAEGGDGMRVDGLAFADDSFPGFDATLRALAGLTGEDRA